MRARVLNVCVVSIDILTPCTCALAITLRAPLLRLSPPALLILREIGVVDSRLPSSPCGVFVSVLFALAVGLVGVGVFPLKHAVLRYHLSSVSHNYNLPIPTLCCGGLLPAP